MQVHQHLKKHGIRSTTARTVLVTVARETAVYETCPKVLELLHLACADKTGKLPVQSRSGNNYFLVLCDHNANDFLVDAMPNRKTEIL